MTNDIQNQYDRLDDVPSIMLCMKEVYVVPNRHIRYIITKVFFGTNMAKGSSVHSHGIKMLSLVEKSMISKIHKSTPVVLVGEASTSKAKGKRARRWKRKKGKGKAIIATASATGSPTAPVGMDKGKGKVLERRRKLSKDEMNLRLDDEKIVTAEAVASLNLVISDHILIELKDYYSIPTLWHARVSHISKDRMRKLVDLKSLEVHDLDNLPTCESCLEGKMTKKPFFGQSALASGLLDLIHMDICKPLNTPTGGGYSYFITFTDDHSWYGYIYLMRYKSEGYAFETIAKLLNMAPSKTMHQTPYEIWHGKHASYKYLGVWSDPPKSVKPIGCKWVYKRKLRADGKVTAFKARLIAKGYNQRSRIDFEETYSPVAMAKPI
ncbi:Retrovirus-related Pol polyprotein from transposon RE2 [Sesamum angolense]|uniref:Retrovirus-related Pol polyprotein from transposon RE2 n=1 Tax=Sesamum angolense TaxID=2727404 RepID=A0AAE1X7C7_9LAMI|nr:Retrovirus-related Pol polyprotein from transposon RE2 [Sesamum angolense]